MEKLSNIYEDRIIGFIDILGFRELINSTVRETIINQVELDNLISVMQLIKDEFEQVVNASELPTSFKITFFSDSIVFSILRSNSLSMLTLFEILKRIQVRLISNKILLRGGIVDGKLIHHQDLILGPAMNAAYDLESKSALYPRIVIDPDIMEMFVTENKLDRPINRLKSYDFMKTFDQDLDNTYFIDYFSDVKEYIDNKDDKEYYKQLRAVIRAGVGRKDMGLRMKYMWMLRKFNMYKPSNIKEMAYKEIDEINEKLEFN